MVRHLKPDESFNNLTGSLPNFLNSGSLPLFSSGKCCNARQFRRIREPRAKRAQAWLAQQAWAEKVGEGGTIQKNGVTGWVGGWVLFSSLPLVFYAESVT
jgi:hypothetical protein